MRFGWKELTLLIALSSAGGCGHGAGVMPSAGGAPAIASPSLGKSDGFAAPSGTRLGAAPAHVLTWVNIGMNGGTTKVKPGQVAGMVGYSTIDQPDSIVAHSLGMKTIIYTDPNRTGPGDLMHTKTESTYAHDCNGKRIGVTGKNKQLMNVESSTLWGEW